MIHSEFIRCVGGGGGAAKMMMIISMKIQAILKHNSRTVSHWLCSELHPLSLEVVTVEKAVLKIAVSILIA